MEFRKEILLKDGRECVLRNGTAADARQVLDCFRLTHGQTDFLTSRPEEITYTEEQEAEFLQHKAAGPGEVYILALVDGKLAGTAGIDRVGAYEKTKHRAVFGISVDRDFWSLGIGRALTRACIRCSQAAGYVQLELEAVADNERALALYRSVGFTEYGRNPRGFRSRGRWQELVLMRLELDE